MNSERNEKNSRSLLERDDVILIQTDDICDIKDSLFTIFWNGVLNVYSQLDIWSYRAFIQKSRTTTYLTATQTVLRKREMIYVQGKGFGGSSNVNAMIWTPGCRSVFDNQWPTNWNSLIISHGLELANAVLKPSIVNTSGNMKCLICRDGLLMEESTQSKTYWDDNNHCRPTYFSSITTDGMRRIDLKRVVLDESNLNKKAGRLTIVHDTVYKVLFTDNIATSVEAFTTPSTTSKTIHPKSRTRDWSPLNGGEIVLCAGVFETPRILINSGLHRSSCMSHSSNSSNSRRSETTIELPSETLPDLIDIGRNLQDHVVLPYLLLGNWHGNWSLVHGPEAPSGYRGQNRYPLNGVHGWINLDAQGNVCLSQESQSSSGDDRKHSPSAQLLFVDGRIAGGLTDMLLPRCAHWTAYATYIRPVLSSVLKFLASLSLFQWLFGHVFGVLVCVTAPHSRGSLRVDPADPTGPLIVDLKYLSDPKDVDILTNALRTAQSLVRIGRRKDDLKCVEILPGPLFRYGLDSAALKSFIALFTTTYFHACGTCAMSSDSDSADDEVDVRGGGIVAGGVVDDELRVRGVHGLRIVDASVIPSIPSGPIAAVCMAMAEVTAERMLQNKK